MINSPKKLVIMGDPEKVMEMSDFAESLGIPMEDASIEEYACTCSEQEREDENAKLGMISLIIQGKSILGIEDWQERSNAAYELAHKLQDFADWLHEIGDYAGKMADKETEENN